MVNRIELPKDQELAGKVIASQTRQEEQKLEMGWIGRCFGSVEHKPGNIAGIAILGSILMVLAIVFFAPAGAPTGELYTLFGGIITLALGYLFGRGGRSD